LIFSTENIICYFRVYKRHKILFGILSLLVYLSAKMNRKHLPALIVSATALLGISYGLKVVVDSLTSTTTMPGIEAVVENPPSKEALEAHRSSTARKKRPRLMELFAYHHQNQPPENDGHESYWSSLFQQNGTFIPYTEEGDSPDFEDDCKTQCVYLENNNKTGFIRYEPSPGTILPLRVPRDHRLQNCEESSEVCETAYFCLNGTYLIIDNFGEFKDFGITNYNYSDSKEIDEYVRRVADDQ